jgi:hypothetical protein
MFFPDESKNKKASYFYEALVKEWQRLTLPGFILVPSALAGLTALFGMGRGDPRRYSHHKVLMIVLAIIYWLVCGVYVINQTVNLLIPLTSSQYR